MKCLIAWLFCVFPAFALADEPPSAPATGPIHEPAIWPRAVAVSVGPREPRLDGVASAEEWAGAAVLHPFVAFSPDDKGAAGVAAEGRILRTAEAIWVTITVGVPASEVNRGLGPRDGYPTGDYVEIQLDPFASGLRAYSFVVSASGQLRDATVNDSSMADPSWDSLFDAAVSVEAERWVVEMKIPLNSLPHAPEVGGWRMNLFASSWSRQQTVVWSAIERELPNRLSQAGWLSGMTGVGRSGGLSFFPAITLDAAGESMGFTLGDVGVERTGLVAAGGAIRPSLTGLWQPEPQSRVEAAWNPDYSQVEADAGQLEVNNRFALYLDEKRPFFLEGKDLFTLPTQLIYTRSIGRPLYAAKGLTEWSSGRAGLIAAYDVESARRGDDGESVVFAERAQFDVGERHLIGQTLTYRGATPNDADVAKSQNFVGGLDGAFYLLPTLRLKADLAVSHTEEAKVEPNATAAGSSLSWEQKKFRLVTTWQRIEEDFRADVGFVNRLGFQSVRAKLDGYYRSSEGRISYASPGIWQQQYWDIDGQEVESVTGINSYILTADRSFVYATFIYNRERAASGWLETPVGEIAAGVEPTDWLSVEGGSEVGSAVLRDESLVGTNAAGEPNPARVGYEISPFASAVVRPLSAMAVSVDWQTRGLFEEAGGEELSRQQIIRGKLQYWFHRTADVRYIYQWDSLAAAANHDLLFSYQPMPGTVFYSGLQHSGATGEKEDRWSLFLKAAVRLEAL